MRNLQHLNKKVVKVTGTLDAIAARAYSRREFAGLEKTERSRGNCFCLSNVTVDNKYHFDHLWVKYFKDELGVNNLSYYMGRTLDIDAKCFQYSRCDGTSDYSFKEAYIVDVI